MPADYIRAGPEPGDGGGGDNLFVRLNGFLAAVIDLILDQCF